MSREKAIELLKQTVCPECANSGRTCKAKDNDMDYQVEWEDCNWCLERNKIIELLESELKAKDRNYDIAIDIIRYYGLEEKFKQALKNETKT